MKVYRATGRRKNAVAQVRLVSPGTGKCLVNRREIENYFTVEIQRATIYKPLEITNNVGNFDMYVTCRGGGKSGQTGATQLGVARALVEFNEDNRTSLRNAGMLTRDPRMVERKKYGQKKARKRFQFSKR